jgi:hypothetical protein
MIGADKRPMGGAPTEVSVAIAPDKNPAVRSEPGLMATAKFVRLIATPSRTARPTQTLTKFLSATAAMR